MGRSEPAEPIVVIALRRALRAAALLAFGMGGVAYGATVTLCEYERQPGPGINLAKAVADGGVIAFDCGARRTLEVRSALVVTRAIRLLGANAITLVAKDPTSAPMFEVPGDVKIDFERIRLVGRVRLALTTPLPPDLIRAPRAAVGMREVRVTDSHFPIAARTGQLESVVFEKNRRASSFRSVIVTGSMFRGNGGALETQDGDMTVVDTTFIGNERTALQATGHQCKVSIRNASFANNYAPIVMLRVTPAVSIACDAEIARSRFEGNAGRNGGALRLIAAAPRTVLIRSTEFRDNRASVAGGAIVIEGSTAVALELRNVKFIGNEAPLGGAIALTEWTGQHSLEVRRAIFDGNRASVAGGAIAARGAALRASQVIFKRNAAPLGAALYLVAPINLEESVIANSTLFDNDGQDGTALALAGRAVLMNTTISGNRGRAISGALTPDDVRGLRDVDAQPATALALLNTIVANNTGGGCGVKAEDRGRNLQFPDADCGATIRVADPLLDELLVPMQPSLALSGGRLDACLAAPVSAVDLLGQRRPRGSSCSIGAIEGELDPVAAHKRPSRNDREPTKWPWTRKAAPQQLEDR